MAGLTPPGRRSLLQLTNRMRDNFCSTVCASTVRLWHRLHVASFGDDVKVKVRKSTNADSEPSGVILSAATSVWMPVKHQQLFSFLRDEKQRSKWDILSNGLPLQEIIHIPKGQTSTNCISLLRPTVSKRVSDYYPLRIYNYHSRGRLLLILNIGILLGYRIGLNNTTYLTCDCRL